LQESVIAYEPVWAIGTGRNATPNQAQEAHAFIRHTLREMTDESTPDRVRIQYGGSMQTQHHRQPIHRPDDDGAHAATASPGQPRPAQLRSNRQSRARRRIGLLDPTTK